MYGRGCCCRPSYPVAPVVPVNYASFDNVGVGIIAIAILILIALGVIL
ncbi:MAG: hypothetical protein GX091_07600 [Peptococcaceae bacterium]|nr:hypothetical protein [Peptococcaceae bacterium]